MIKLLGTEKILPPPVFANPFQKLLLGLEKFAGSVRFANPEPELVLISDHLTGITPVFAHE